MTSPTQSPTESASMRVIRVSLLWIFLFGSIGTAAELLLLEHFEDFWQWIPLMLIGVALPCLLAMLVSPARAARRVFEISMVLIVASGLQGLFLHYKGNAEFEIEMYPSLEGLGLFWEALRGATPTLAPGTMSVLGLIGLVYSYCHGRVSRLTDRPITVE